MTNKIPDWKLERYLLGELPPSETDSIRALASRDEALQSRVNALLADNAKLLAEYPPEQVAKRIRNLCAAARDDAASAQNRNRANAFAQGRARVSMWHNIWNARTAFRAAAPAFVCAAAFRAAVPAFVCAMAFLILPARQSPHDNSAFAFYEDRVKGSHETERAQSVAIEVWRKEGNVARKLSNDDVAYEGDVIQLRYVVPRECYGALVSVDGRGVFTVHLSSYDGKAVPLAADRPVALRDSYELDDAPLYEVFYLITADANFQLSDIASALESVSVGGHPAVDIDALFNGAKDGAVFVLRKPGRGVSRNI